MRPARWAMWLTQWLPWIRFHEWRCSLFLRLFFLYTYPVSLYLKTKIVDYLFLKSIFHMVLQHVFGDLEWRSSGARLWGCVKTKNNGFRIQYLNSFSDRYPNVLALFGHFHTASEMRAIIISSAPKVLNVHNPRRLLLGRQSGVAGMWKNKSRGLEYL